MDESRMPDEDTTGAAVGTNARTVAGPRLPEATERNICTRKRMVCALRPAARQHRPCLIFRISHRGFELTSKAFSAGRNTRKICAAFLRQRPALRQLRLTTGAPACEEVDAGCHCRF